MARVRLFASLREAAGVHHDDIPAANVRALLTEARTRYGREFARDLGFARVAVNGVDVADLAGGDTPLSDEDEVSLLPPVSGGEGPLTS